MYSNSNSDSSSYFHKQFDLGSLDSKLSDEKKKYFSDFQANKSK